MVRIFRFLSLAIVFASCSSGVGDIDYSAGVDDIPDLAGKTVSVYSGSLQDFEVSALYPTPDILRFNSVSEMIISVQSGKSDYCMSDSVSFIGAGIEEKGLKLLFTSDIVSGPIGAAFRFDSTPLRDDFNAFLARARADGRMAEMETRWTKGDVTKVVMKHKELDPDGEILTVGINNLFPFTFVQDGQFAGLEIEMLESFAAETGRKVEYKLMDFSGILAALISGKIDMVCCCLTITDERARQVLFSDPYYFCRTACLCRSTIAERTSKSFILSLKESFYNNLVIEDRWKIILAGLWETLVIALMSILFGTLLGSLICMMKLSHKRILEGFANVYVEIIRGLPVLVLLMLMFYVVFASGTISARWVAILAFALNFGAYVSEMFRTGIEGVDRGQTEAGLAMGFSRVRTFFLFVVPQAASKVIPVFKGEAVSLIKNTSVVGFIAIQDLTKASEIIRSRTFDAFFPLIVISIIYFILAWLLGKCLDRLANKTA